MDIIGFYIAEILKSIYYILTHLSKDNITDIIIGIASALIGTLIAYYFNEFKKAIGKLKKSIVTTESSQGDMQIAGATFIDQKFKDQTISFGKKRKFKPEDFYMSKLDYSCQWYGIIKKWDIERKAYSQIQDEIKKAFEDEYRQPKILALIHGHGGSGKSTLLRRLALYSIGKDFLILWINSEEISKFHEKGISQLGSYTNKKILIFIEDWYRIKQNTSNPREIINSICNYPNVRVVVGDRTIDNTISKEHIYDPDNNIIELSVNENQKTISKILEIVPEWGTIVKTLLPRPESYDSSLYLILWVVVRTYQNKNKKGDGGISNKKDLIGHFRSIVESDLRVIVKGKFSGIAKMLYYYGSVYSERKTYMGVDIFLKLADYFKDDLTDNKTAFSSPGIKSTLQIYIHKNVVQSKKSSQLPLIIFNHDILADEGLSKVQIDGWQKYDDSIKFQILTKILNEGDDFSASNFLYYTILTTSEEGMSNKDKIDYINTLFERGNRGSYLSCIFNGTVKLTPEEKEKYAVKILKDFNYATTSAPIRYSLVLLKSHPEGIQAISNILAIPDLYNLPEPILSTAMRLSNNETEKKKAARTILTQPDISIFPHQIVSPALKLLNDEEIATNILSGDVSKFRGEVISTALKISQNNKIKQKVANDILLQPKFFNLRFDLGCTALKITRNAELRQKAISEILSQPNFFDLPNAIVSTAMRLSKDETERQKSATTILTEPDIFKLPAEIVTTAIRISTNDEVRQKAITHILSQPDFFRTHQNLVPTAIKYSNNEAERQKSAKEIISQPDFYILNVELITVALIILKDLDKAEFIIKNWESHPWGAVFPSLYCFTEVTPLPRFVVDLVDEIIKTKNVNKKHYFYYSQLLKIPFHEIPSWAEECNSKINTYQMSNISIYNSILRAFIMRPDRIKNLCRTILRNWRAEITVPIIQLYGLPPVYGGNIMIALGHPDPDIKILAKATAKEICEAEFLIPGCINEELLDKAQNIVNNDKYPEWSLEPAEKV